MKNDPTLDEVVTAVNNNSSKVNSLVSEDGSLGVSSSPWTAKCRMAFRRESNIRLVGNLNMVGPVVDFGSNGDIFWFWFKNQEPNQISYCKLSEYADSSMLEQIPVDPIWFPEALGIVKIDPADVIEGPVVDRDNTIKLVLKRTRPEGDYHEYIYLESKTAAIRRLDVRNPVTNEILTVSCDEFQLDKEYGVVLPKKISISRSLAKERLFIDFGTLRVNATDAPLTFSPPNPEELGVPLVDIGPNGAARSASVPQASSSDETVAANLTGGVGSAQPASGNSLASPSETPGNVDWGTGNVAPDTTKSSSVSSNPISPLLRSEYEKSEITSTEIPSGSSGSPGDALLSSAGVSVKFDTVVLPANSQSNL
ncbi:MAG: hypothetical protein ACOX6D_00530 [Thermoguttaceae bacterium]